MGSFKRDERQILRNIQAHLCAAILREGAAIEQLGTVDVYCHPSNPAPHLNSVTPHKGVAWIRREDLRDAFTGLERLGHIPRLVFLEALFPSAFRQQIEWLGLTLEDERLIMAYRPLYGPHLPGEVPHGHLPEQYDEAVTTALATTQTELATWLRVFRAAYYNTESLVVQPGEVKPLHAAAEAGDSVFVIGNYEHTPLGAAHVALAPPTARLEAVATAPLWHGMGLESALIATAVRAGLDRGCDTVFTVAPPADLLPLYRRLGFCDLTHLLIFWRLEDDETQPIPDAERETPSDDPDLA